MQQKSQLYLYFTQEKVFTLVDWPFKFHFSHPLNTAIFINQNLQVLLSHSLSTYTISCLRGVTHINTHYVQNWVLFKLVEPLLTPLSLEGDGGAPLGFALKLAHVTQFTFHILPPLWRQWLKCVAFPLCCDAEWSRHVVTQLRSRRLAYPRRAVEFSL